MKVILREKVGKLGNPGDIVEVKPGYGRNFLLPRGIAFPATESNVRKVELEKKRQFVKKEKELQSAKALAEKLASTSITIPVSVSEDEKLYGSVTSVNIWEMLKQEGIELDKTDIMLDEPIKKLGVYSVKVKCGPDAETAVKVWVVKK